MELKILYEDNHLLAVSKPAGLATMGVPADKPSLLGLCKEYIKKRYDKPGNVYLGIVSRLDAPVTGVILLARTSKAAARLTDQFRGGDVKKLYWALVEGAPDPSTCDCQDWLRHDDRHRRMHVAAPSNPDAKEARLSYRTIRRVGNSSLLEVELQTGRKHQIRLQLAHRGWPILGDRKYGSRRAFRSGIALHARYLALQHPVGNERLEFTAALPKSWPELS
jgi:23S rRNA pseudouridine1911/1915/1917 synthase